MAKKKTARKTVERVFDKLIGAFKHTSDDISEVIKADHEALRSYLGVLKDTDRPMKLRRRAYAEFSALLKSHTVAEETAIYGPTKRMRGHEMHVKVAEGYVEHGMSNDLMKRLDRTRDELTWTAHANVLAEIIEHHLKEEERDLLPLIDDVAPLPKRKKMLAEFFSIRKSTQKKRTDENLGALALT